MNFSRRIYGALTKMPGIPLKGTLVYSTSQNDFKFNGISVETKGNVRSIWLDKPSTRNALNKEMFEELTKIVNESTHDDKILLCVLRGKGSHFCNGIDLKTVDLLACRALKRYVSSLINFPKLLIAAVNGPVLGVGVTILGLFDIVYAKDTATFQTPFSTIGSGPEACSSHTFPQLMGKKKAFELLLLGKKINAAEAKDRYNLVTEIFSSQEFDSEIEKRISEISELPKLSLMFTKELIHRIDKYNLHETNEKEAEKIAKCLTSQYTKEFLAKFQKKN